MTDEQLIQGLRDKSPEAFDAVYERLYRRLVLFAQNLVADPAEAKDIVSDAFVKFWTQQKTFTDLGHIEGFFYTTIKNSAIDYLRKNKTRIKVEGDLMKSSKLSENTIEHKYQEAEIIQRLYERINELPERQQQVFKLTYLEGYSRAEVAQMLDISENTVRNTNAMAMKSLKMALGVDDAALLVMLAVLRAIM
jgi:RNA polymerase sigma-70 factor (ECF subfamily)